MMARRRGWLAASAFAIIALVLTACAKGLPQDSLEPAGPRSRTIDALFMPVFWIAVGVFVLVEGLLVVAMIRYRHREGARVPKQIHGNKRLEIGWTVAPALLLAVIAVPTVGTIFSLAARPSGNVLEVHVTGHQWWWQVEYPDLDVVTANEIHIPTGRPVYVTLTSPEDNGVIHSFWVPRLAGKQDLIPGRTTAVTIEADEPGVYLGQCAEFCGASHAFMRFRVMAQPAEAFDAWVEAQKQPAAQPTDPRAAEGAKIFATGAWAAGTCIGCHTVHGVEGAAGLIGPDLTHFGSRSTLAGATLRNTPGQVARWLHDPQAIKPEADMPNLGLTQDEIDGLVAYLESLK